MIHFKKWLVSSIIVCASLGVYGRQSALDNSLSSLNTYSNNSIFSRMGKPSKNSGFAMKGYWIWDGYAVRGEDGKYHMFCSRWPDSLLMHPAWMATSEVIHGIVADAIAPISLWV